MPEVTVIVPAYNAELMIAETLEALLNQSMANLRVIVIDDASTDATRDKISAVSDARITTLHNANNLGVAETRNRGLKYAKTRYIAFCDADDIWLPHKLDYQLQAIRANQCPVVFSYLQVFSADDPNGKIRTAPTQVFLRDIKRRNYIYFSSALVDTEQLAVKRFRQIFHEDYDFWLKNAIHYEQTHSGPFAICVPKVLCRYRVHKTNLSRNKIRSVLKHFAVQRANHISWLEIAMRFSTNIAGRIIERLRPPERR